MSVTSKTDGPLVPSDERRADTLNALHSTVRVAADGTVAYGVDVPHTGAARMTVTESISLRRRTYTFTDPYGGVHSMFEEPDSE